MECRQEAYFRNRKMASADAIERAQARVIDRFEREIIRPIVDADEVDGFNDELPLALQTESLKGYVDDLHKLQQDAASGDKQ